MNIHPVLSLVGLCSATLLYAQRTTVSRTVSIQLGPMRAGFAVALPPAPYTVAPGTHLQLTTPSFSYANFTVAWYKDNKPLTATGPTLDIPSASAGDTGNYYAIVTPAPGAGKYAQTTDIAGVLVAPDGLRLANVSNRGRVDGSEGSLLAGFVVQGGPSRTYVLVRAVGPALASYGVAHPLPSPALRVVDSAGTEMPTGPDGTIEGIKYPDAAAMAPVVGAFPLAANGKDVAKIYFLPTGVYSALVSSADGHSGTALIEIYQMTPDQYESQLMRQGIPAPTLTPNPQPGFTPPPTALTPGAGTSS